MTNGTTGECPEPTPRPGYFTISPPVTPHASSVYWGPQTCCCSDTAGTNALDLLLAYILIKKAANPQIVRAKKTFSPNHACEAVVVDWEFGGGGPNAQSVLDQPDILLYFIALLASL